MCSFFHFMLSKATELYKVNENLSLLTYFWPGSSYIFKGVYSVYLCVYIEMCPGWRITQQLCGEWRSCSASVHFLDWSLAGALLSQLEIGSAGAREC